MPNLQDLIGVRGSSAERELQNRGYTYIKTTKSNYSAYTNWWHNRAKKCVSIRISNGKVQSAVYAMPADCNKKQNYNDNDTYGGYGGSGVYNENRVDVNDLKGWDALKAYDELEIRGFREVRNFSSSGKTYRFWYNKRTNQCIKTLSKKKKITEIIRSTRCK